VQVKDLGFNENNESDNKSLVGLPGIVDFNSRNHSNDFLS
jgi:hypothetical protein